MRITEMKSGTNTKTVIFEHYENISVKQTQISVFGSAFLVGDKMYEGTNITDGTESAGR